ncbi:hypothetical protein F5887DRAFT_919496 [Amanita rubescens]|nr:hypothetical protein F5887DRAFT_919496 [Amanita rubescens]
MEVYDQVTIELDMALVEHAAASALVTARQACVDGLELLKTKKRKGYSNKKWKSAVAELEDAKADAKVTKGKVDALEARQKEAVKANDLGKISSGQHKQPPGTSATGDSVNGDNASARSSARPSENTGGSSSTATGGPGKPQAQQRQETRPDLPDQRNGEEARSDSPDLPDQRNGEEARSDLPDQRNGEEARSDSPYLPDQRSSDRDDEEARSDVAENNSDRDGEEARSDVAENNSDRDDEEVQSDVPGEPNAKKRKHEVEDEEATDNEGHMGQGPRKRTKKKEKEEKLDEQTYYWPTHYPEKILSDVNDFIRRPYTSRLKVATRSAIRTHQSLAPAAATSFKTLAMEILKTNRGNVLCPYHQEMDKRGVTDTLNVGVPRSRMVVGKKRHANSDEHRNRLNKGFLHCGCPISAGLWDFYFWKSLKLTVDVEDDNGVTERITECVPRWTPRDRAFFYRIWKKYTFLKVDDLYTKEMSPDQHEEKMLTDQADRILKRVNKLREKRGAKGMRLHLEDSEDENEPSPETRSAAV